MKARRRKALGQKRAAKRARYAKEGSSKYARKARYLARRALFGFQVAEPKPWKVAG